MDQNDRSYNILVYGIERKRLKAPSEPVKTRNYTLIFEPFDSLRRFNEFDGVIVFQGTFEVFERVSSSHSSPYLNHRFDENELHKRSKELKLLLEAGGFVCFILTIPLLKSTMAAIFVPPTWLRFT
jgi:hypothetical protein